MKQQPRLALVSVDLIEPDPRNPRLSLGPDYPQLLETVREFGILEPPLVRRMPGNRYQLISGWRRWCAAKEVGLDEIWVVDLGRVSDDAAALQRQITDVARGFQLLEECRGWARLFEQGYKALYLAEKFGYKSRESLTWRIGIGSFPDKLLRLIAEDMSRSQRRARLWSLRFLIGLLPLRQLRHGVKEPTRGDSVGENVYNFAEVEKAVHLIISGEIQNRDQLDAYVAQRRAQLWEERFDQRLRAELEKELAAAQEALEQSHLQALEGIQAELTQEYERQVEELQAQVEGLQQSLARAMAKTARRPEVVEALQRNLQEQINALKVQRRKVQARLIELDQAKAAALADFEKQRRAWEAQAQEVLIKRLVQQEAQMRNVQEKLEAAFASRTAEAEARYQLEAERTLNSVISNFKANAASVEQLVWLLTSPDYITNLDLLTGPEVEGLLAAMESLEEILARGRAKIMGREDWEDSAVIEIAPS